MSTAFFQADSGVEKMLVRINPGERQKIIVENFLTHPASRGNLLYLKKTAQKKHKSLRLISY
jgi:hypothetical protein